MSTSSSAPVNPLIDIFCQEIDPPAESSLRLLPEGCKDWETNNTNLPPGSIVLGELLLRMLRFPLHLLIHYICTMCNLFPMQLALNVSCHIMGFITLNTIANLQLSFEDFWHIYGLTKSVGSLSIEWYTLSPHKPFSLFQVLPTSNKD